MEIQTSHLKIMLSIAVGVIIIMFLFMIAPEKTVSDDSKARIKEDSLNKALTDMGFALTLSKKNEVYLQKRSAAWKDTLTKERIRNKARFTEIMKKPVVRPLTQPEVDSTLSARYNKSVHIDPPEVGSQVVAELDILDQSLAFLPQEEKEIEDLHQALAVKDSLGVEHAKQDSIQSQQSSNLIVQLQDKHRENDALKKDNKKLTLGNRFWKGACKVLGGIAVTLGILVIIQ